MLDQEGITKQKELLAIYRRNLAHLLRQAAQYGGESSAPLSVFNQIQEERANIKHTKALLRANGLDIPDLPGDIYDVPLSSQKIPADKPHSINKKFYGLIGVVILLATISTIYYFYSKNSGYKIPNNKVVYFCTTGLCLGTFYSQTVQTIARFTPTKTLFDSPIHGFAISRDGSIVVYAFTDYNTPKGIADIFAVHTDIFKPQKILQVKGAINGVGEPQGYGVIGLTPDGTRIIFEDEAQVYMVNLDGSNRKPITPQIQYGAIDSHAFSLSSDGNYILEFGNGIEESATVYNVYTGEEKVYEFEDKLSPVFL